MPGLQSEKAEGGKWSMESKTRDGSKGWEGGRGEEPPFSLQAPTTATPCLIPLWPIKLMAYTYEEDAQESTSTVFLSHSEPLFHSLRLFSSANPYPTVLILSSVYSNTNIFGSPSSLFNNGYLS